MVNTANIPRAYSEVYSFINTLGDNYKNKIPKKLYENIEKGRDVNYNPRYDINQKVDKKTFSHEGLALIAALNLQYWCDDEEEKKELKETYLNNTKIERKKQEEEMSPENLFKTSRLRDEERERALEQEREANLALVEEPKGIFGKIIAFFKRLRSRD